MAKRVLVVGGAGFIGSHVVDGLLARGHQAVVYDNFFTGHLRNIGHVRDRVDVIEGDIRDVDRIARACDGIDDVVLLASLRSVPMSMRDPAAFYNVNVVGTQRVLDSAVAAGCRRVVFASSSSVYGTNEEFPSVEGREGEPLSHYANSKRAAERACLVTARNSALDTASLRFFNVFGPRQDPRGGYATVIPIFTTTLLAGERPQIFGDGEQAKDFTHVDNVVAGVMSAVERPEPFHGEVVNLANGTPVSVNTLLKQIRAMVGREDIVPEHKAPRAGDVRRSQASTEKLERLLGYRQVKSFEEGLVETVRWYREHPSYFEGG